MSNIENFIIDDGVEPLTAPVIDVAEADGDGIVDATEAADGVQVQVTLPDGAVAGDLITLTVTTRRCDLRCHRYPVTGRHR